MPHDPQMAERGHPDGRSFMSGTPFMILSILACGPAILFFGFFCLGTGAVMLMVILDEPTKARASVPAFILLGVMPAVGVYGLCRAILSRGTVVPRAALICGVLAATPWAVAFLFGLSWDRLLTEPRRVLIDNSEFFLSLWACIAMALIHLVRETRRKRRLRLMPA